MENIRIECPLGSKCKGIKNDTAYQCAWYVKLAGQTPDGKEVDEWGCAMSWLPTLLIENAMTNRGQTSAIEGLKNEMTEKQDEMNSILYHASRTKRLE